MFHKISYFLVTVNQFRLGCLDGDEIVSCFIQTQGLTIVIKIHIYTTPIVNAIDYTHITL